MNWIDLSILGAYFIVMIGAVFWFSRRSAQGMRSYFLGNNQSKWWMPNAVFLMAYSGLWIRRTGVMTSAELNKARFGVDSGAQAARVTQGIEQPCANSDSPLTLMNQNSIRCFYITQ